MKRESKKRPRETDEAPACGCSSKDHHGPGGLAAGVDPELKAANLARLKRIEGQVRGILGMVEEDRYCADIVTQISAARESLLSVARVLLKNHMKHCASQAISRRSEDADRMYDELVDLMTKMAR